MIDPKLWEQACESANIAKCSGAGYLTSGPFELSNETYRCADCGREYHWNDYSPQHYPRVGDPATVLTMLEWLHRRMNFFLRTREQDGKSEILFYDENGSSIIADSALEAIVKACAALSEKP